MLMPNENAIGVQRLQRLLNLASNCRAEEEEAEAEEAEAEADEPEAEGTLNVPPVGVEENSAAIAVEALVAIGASDASLPLGIDVPPSSTAVTLTEMNPACIVSTIQVVSKRYFYVKRPIGD